MEQKNDIDQLIALMFSMGRLMRKRFNANSGLSPTPSLLQMETLRFVDEKENPPMKQVADFLSISAPSATSLVEDMVGRGYLDRTADEKDRRMIRLSVSKKGKAALSTHVHKKMTHIRKTLGKLSAEDRAQLVRILSKLSNTI